MSTVLRLAAVVMLLSARAVPLEGAPFQNLGFDDANTNNPVSVFGHEWAWGSPQDFLPGWQIAPLFPLAAIGLNARPPGFAYATLWTDQGGFPPVEGRFSLDFFENATSQWTLSQTGDVPEAAKAIHFLSYDAHVQLSLDGVNIPLVYVPRSLTPACCGLPGYSEEVNDVYGDVSAFGGKTVDLEFTTLISNVSLVEADAGLDSISFIVPEPSSWLLLSLGGLWLGFYSKRGRKLNEPQGQTSATGRPS